MAEPLKPIPVKLFTGIFFCEKDLILKLKENLIEKIGEIDYESEVFDFNFTDYYEKEMGKNIKRIFYSFKELIDPAKIVDIKYISFEIEKKFMDSEGKRKINIDPGYMDFFKVVLASFKPGGYKIYLDKGVYADITLWYEKGKFKPLLTSFPDFKNNLYEKTFLKIRELYKKELKKLKLKNI
ncbi:MAG: DUF4416 family protein [candidate division WOR-3 bacterium]